MSDWTSKTGDARILHGSCLERLRDLPEGSVQCCVTSPPYWGLRDYGHSDQLGLEPTPEAYVANMVDVFREVRRVLREDGVLFLNLGDSYASSAGGYDETGSSGTTSTAVSAKTKAAVVRHKTARPPQGLKPKDLVGIPWRVAFALQQPYYSGRITDERDRIWLAAMLDAEGCMFIHKRKAGQSNGQGYSRQSDTYSPGVEICNTSTAIVERIISIVGKGSISSQGPEQNSRRKQTIYRWNLRTTECRDLVRELYPHLVAKKQQARILCGCPSSGKLAEQAHAGLIALHRTGLSDVDFDPPATMFERGYYLRQDIVWSKPNPMPESVTDRCTKAHEYIFLLTKSARYYYDSEAVKESSGKAAGVVTLVSSEGKEGTLRNDEGRIHVSDGTRNRRSVWTVSTKPYSGAHFATYPPDLIEPCILAGTSERGRCRVCGAAWERVVDVARDSRQFGRDQDARQSSATSNRTINGVVPSFRGPESKTTGWQPTCQCNAGEPIPCLVLDPFNGSGTTGEVCIKHGRHYVGCELNQDYIELAKERLGKAERRYGLPLLKTA